MSHNDVDLFFRVDLVSLALSPHRKFRAPARRTMKTYVEARSAGTFLVESTHEWFHTNRRGLSVWMFALVIATLALFPPWIGSTGRFHDYPEREKPLWHAPYWHRPDQPGAFWSVRIDYGRLFIEAIAAESLAAALYLTWGRKES